MNADNEMIYPAWLEEGVRLHYALYGPNISSEELLRRAYDDSQIEKSAAEALASLEVGRVGATGLL